MRAAIVSGGVVRNVIEVTSLSFLPGLVEITDGFGIGDLWDGVKFSKPPAPDPVPVIPASITMRQARLALLDAGLLDDVETAMQAAPRADQITWEFASAVERASPLVQNMAAALSLSEADLDQLFITAAAL